MRAVPFLKSSYRTELCKCHSFCHVVLNPQWRAKSLRNMSVRQPEGQLSSTFNKWFSSAKQITEFGTATQHPDNSRKHHLDQSFSPTAHTRHPVTRTNHIDPSLKPITSTQHPRQSLRQLTLVLDKSATPNTLTNHLHRALRHTTSTNRT